MTSNVLPIFRFYLLSNKSFTRHPYFFAYACNRLYSTMSPTTGVIFDLDGTLLDSLGDMEDACNHALTQFNYSSLTMNEYRHMAGRGNRHLLTQALLRSTGTTPDAELLKKAITYKTAYEEGEHGHKHTKPFQGVKDMLDRLQSHNVQMAILSNKPDHLVQQLTKEHFPHINWRHVAGARNDTPLKPDGFAALRILQQHMEGVTIANCWFVGDTDVDMKTGVNAGMTPIGVEWGFRTVEELFNNGASSVVKSADEIANIILKTSAS